MTTTARLAHLETVYATRTAPRPPEPLPAWLTGLIDDAHRQGRAPAAVIAAWAGIGVRELRDLLERRSS